MKLDNRQIMLDAFRKAGKPLDSIEIQKIMSPLIKKNSICATRSKLVEFGKLVEIECVVRNGMSVRVWKLSNEEQKKEVETGVTDKLSLLESKLFQILKRLKND